MSYKVSGVGYGHRVWNKKPEVSTKGFTDLVLTMPILISFCILLVLACKVPGGDSSGVFVEYRQLVSEPRQQHNRLGTGQ